MKICILLNIYIIVASFVQSSDENDEKISLRKRLASKYLIEAQPSARTTFLTLQTLNDIKTSKLSIFKPVLINFKISC